MATLLVVVGYSAIVSVLAVRALNAVKKPAAKPAPTQQLATPPPVYPPGWALARVQLSVETGHDGIAQSLIHRLEGVLTRAAEARVDDFRRSFQIKLGPLGRVTLPSLTLGAPQLELLQGDGHHLRVRARYADARARAKWKGFSKHVKLDLSVEFQLALKAGAKSLVTAELVGKPTVKLNGASTSAILGDVPVPRGGLVAAELLLRSDLEPVVARLIEGALPEATATLQTAIRLPERLSLGAGLLDPPLSAPIKLVDFGVSDGALWALLQTSDRPLEITLADALPSKWIAQSGVEVLVRTDAINALMATAWSQAKGGCVGPITMPKRLPGARSVQGTACSAPVFRYQDGQLRAQLRRLELSVYAPDWSRWSSWLEVESIVIPGKPEPATEENEATGPTLGLTLAPGGLLIKQPPDGDASPSLLMMTSNARWLGGIARGLGLADQPLMMLPINLPAVPWLDGSSTLRTKRLDVRSGGGAGYLVVGFGVSP